MEKVGVRDLKNNLSSYMRNVKKGESFIVTDRGIEVALIEPVNSIKYKELLLMVKDNQAEWSGQKPKFSGKTVKVKGEKTASEIVIEDRR